MWQSLIPKPRYVYRFAPDSAFRAELVVSTWHVCSDGKEYVQQPAVRVRGECRDLNDFKVYAGFPFVGWFPAVFTDIRSHTM